MEDAFRRATICAAAFGFLGVLLGALGAHALKPVLAERGMIESWNTAVIYHLVHSVALLALGVSRSPGVRPGAVTASWVAGILLFAGSIYALALGAPRWLGPLTPIGGLALLAGWAHLGWQATRRNAG